MKPKEIAPGEWRRERVGYGIYSPKGLNIAKRLHGHQNILRAEMIAIHKTLRIINTQYPNEPAFIFTDSLNVLYLLNTQIKHPTLHNSHPDQTTLASMVKFFKNGHNQSHYTKLEHTSTLTAMKKQINYCSKRRIRITLVEILRPDQQKINRKALVAVVT
jgi:hypothetical protein